MEWIILAAMRVSRYLLATLKESPADAEVLSHQLMLRAGMIRRVAAGVYNWLPLGLRVLRKVENIIREEMDRAGAQEVLLPAVQPGELWKESGRWEEYGPELLRFTDRHRRDFCIGPTHEEIITALIKNEVRSYRQLPANYYQIQTKFRDEIRPRFGVMRGREFIMKDAYSFDADPAGMQKSFDAMHGAYTAIFSRMQLQFTSVQADPGAIGGNFSSEFHVLADSGEDAIATCTAANYAANAELVPLPPPTAQRPPPGAAMEEVSTPGAATIADLCAACGTTPQRAVKTLLVKGEAGPVALVLRGDHDLSPVKAEAVPGVRAPLQFADAAEMQAAGTVKGFAGPAGLAVKVVADHGALQLADFYCGANHADAHYKNANWERDMPLPEAADLRKAAAGDPCPAAGGVLKIRRGIEVGHIFQLGQKYSRAMDATCLNEAGEAVPMFMGCYGIGVTRLVAACIEQNHDQRGIIWPAPLAPFDVCLVPIGYHKSAAVRQAADALHQSLAEAGVQTLLDDRNERPGVMFADMELIGIPRRLVLSEQALNKSAAEHTVRRSGETEMLPLDGLVEELRRRVQAAPK